MLWFSIIWGFWGMVSAIVGVKAIVAIKLELGGEDGRTPTILRGLSAVVAGTIITGFGIGMLLIAVLVSIGGP